MRTGIERIIHPGDILRVPSPNGESKVIVEGLEGQTRLGNIDEEYSRRFLYVSLDGQKGFVPFAYMRFLRVDANSFGDGLEPNMPYKISQFGTFFEDEQGKYLNLTPVDKEMFKRFLIENINKTFPEIRVNNQKLYHYRRGIFTEYSPVQAALEATGEVIGNFSRQAVVRARSINLF